jgi:hypothetical protein
VGEHGDVFDRVVVLRAEVAWEDGKPTLVEVPVDYAVLGRLKTPVGLALRVGAYSGAFGQTNPAAIYLAGLAERLVQEAESKKLGIKELQVDFDCATAKLAGYQSWVELLRERVAPVPVAITVLPTWMDDPAFRPLVEAAGQYVLQVHSLERPRSLESELTLMNPSAARSAVAKASRLGVPFRVALPTYGYTVAFDGQGRFLGLSAEGSARNWPAGARLREVRANPLEIAPLVRDWSTNRPAALAGIIWYRLPTVVDNFNWRWPTLNAMVGARIPRKSVRVDTHRVESGLVEISLVNNGELDISSRLAVQTRWSGARLIAGDGLRGFELADREASSVLFTTGSRPHRLPAGEQEIIGWLRLSADREVQVELLESGER